MTVVAWVYSQSPARDRPPAGGRLPTWRELRTRWNETHSEKEDSASDMLKPYLKRGLTTLLGPDAVAYAKDRGLWPED